MKLKYLLLIMLISLVGIVTAQSLTISPIPPLNANHDSTITGTFNVTAVGDLSSITVSGTNITFNPSTFSLKDESKVVSFSINIPKHTAPSTYNYPFKAINGTTAIQASGEIKVTVNSTPSLSLSFREGQPTQLSRSSKNTTLVVTNDGNVPLSGINLSYDPNTFKDRIGRAVTLTFSNPTLS
ncbi:hypothetical protein HYV49_00965, partial [Candidatus Pacearchaeota archaeon]|nr:hypothetical protein [Candidatus Pacearchaeota archaeon]